ncbi:MAG: DUF167 family protein [Rhizomicrobium sp.]
MRDAFRIVDGILRFHVRLTPKGGRDAIDGWTQGADGAVYLKARVAAVAEDGKANAALIAVLAKTLGVAKSKVTIVSGTTSRLKTIDISGDAPKLAAQLGALGEAR